MIPLHSTVNENRRSTFTEIWVTNDVQQTWYTQYGKRIFDVAVALLVCVFVLSWLFPLMGLAICACSPGPALFIQERTGRRGTVFGCFKFRTMRHQADATFRQATASDSRVTAIGRFLRKTNLDELPQFLNVLLGDMSIVGPRPHAVAHDAQYWASISNYRYRYTVKPGITGLAQVRGARGEACLMKMRHRVKYDLHYMKRQSLLFDVYLCWATARQMLTGCTNAY
ncbi:sugar transferase [Fibrella aquatilis]|uniref:Sugar transferase n=1 Tax=Fibrella aquatilis TaxID=2817059 RepID=A0A939G6Q0_9BACT|nr:sugar transferase [Fibrella aquatilis]MBO0933184.1 sugar transferase [Fibrella aquatilis]